MVFICIFIFSGVFRFIFIVSFRVAGSRKEDHADRYQMKTIFNSAVTVETNFNTAIFSSFSGTAVLAQQGCCCHSLRKDAVLLAKKKLDSVNGACFIISPVLCRTKPQPHNLLCQHFNALLKCWCLYIARLIDLLFTISQTWVKIHMGTHMKWLTNQTKVQWTCANRPSGLLAILTVKQGESKRARRRRRRIVWESPWLAL